MIPFDTDADAIREYILDEAGEYITPEPAASSEEPDMLFGGTAKTPD